MKPWFECADRNPIPIQTGIVQEFEKSGDGSRRKIRAHPSPQEPRHVARSRASRPAVSTVPKGVVAVVLDDPSRQPHQAQQRRPQGRRPSGVVRLARHHHVGAVFLRAAPRGPRRGEAACEPGVPRDPVSVRPAEPRQAGEFSRLQGRAVLSLAHQGHRRRRFLHRLGGPRRGADVVLVAGAGLRHVAWLDEGSPGGPDDRAGRRRRDGRGQHLRGAAGRLEARPAQHLVGGRLQPPEPGRRGARRAVGEVRDHVPQFRLGRGDREIRPADAGGVRGSRRRGAEALDRQLPEPALCRAVFPGRGGVPQASGG